MNTQVANSNAARAKVLSGNMAVSEIRNAHQALNLYGRKSPLSKVEAASLKRLVELHAFREEWDRVVDLASKSIVVGLRPQDEITLYRLWIEGLNEDLDIEGLTELGKHLLGRRQDKVEYLALAALAFVYSGKNNAVRSAVGQLYRMEAGGVVVEEILATVKCESLNREERLMGLRELASTLGESDAGYFSYRRFLGYAFENNALSTAAAAVKTLHKKYPESPDAYIVSALVDVNEGRWTSAQKSLDVVLANNPANTDAVLMKARCLEMTKKFEEARYFLLRNSARFAQGDYEFHIQIGMLEKRMWESMRNEVMLRDSASQHLKLALEAAHVYQFPTAPIQAALTDIGAIAVDSEPAQQRYWLLKLTPKYLASMLDHEGFQLRCPREVQMGDVIFFGAEGRGSKSIHSVSGFFRAQAQPVPDFIMGLTVRLGSAVVFENDVEVGLSNGVYEARDTFGIENFSKNGTARFYELDAAIADDIVTEVENMSVRLSRAM